MQITRNSLQTMPGPSEWFTGAVYVDAVAAPSGASRVRASSVHFDDKGNTATWGDHVSEAEYAAAPRIEA